MRESRVLEKKKLPGSVYETWLGEQHPEHTSTAHRSPPPDVYEAWVEEKVRRKTAAPQAKAD
jgi:hypothetical protein